MNEQADVSKSGSRRVVLTSAQREALSVLADAYPQRLGAHKRSTQTAPIPRVNIRAANELTRKGLARRHIPDVKFWNAYSCDYKFSVTEAGRSAAQRSRRRSVPDRDEGATFEPIRYGDEAEDWGAAGGRRCHDCNAAPGQFHLPGCDVERCPIDGGQLISCGHHAQVKVRRPDGSLATVSRPPVP